MMDLPKNLIDQVRQGRAVLFLGAGASLGARTADDNVPPLGDELRNRIAEQFLKQDYSSENLAWVSELAISATDFSFLCAFWQVGVKNLPCGRKTFGFLWLHGASPLVIRATYRGFNSGLK